HLFDELNLRSTAFWVPAFRGVVRPLWVVIGVHKETVLQDKRVRRRDAVERVFIVVATPDKPAVILSDLVYFPAECGQRCELHAGPQAPLLSLVASANRNDVSSARGQVLNRVSGVEHFAMNDSVIAGVEAADHNLILEVLPEGWLNVLPAGQRAPP